MSQSNQINTHALKIVAAVGAILVLWLLAMAQAYSSIVDTSTPWHWQVARAIPGLLVSLYVTGILVPCLRHTQSSQEI
ncbi:MAG: hypothetical protein GKR90_14120 [Pseudomonadales bacterium]|nr:hypothetical protein [Pseudomonadales bacterium]